MAPRFLLRVLVMLSGLSLLTPTVNAGDIASSALDKAWSKIANPAPDLGAREIMGFILEAAGSPGYEQRIPRIEEAFQRLEKMQDRDPASKTYGNFCWYWREQKPGDLNAVEFIVQQAVLLRLRYPDHLSPKARESLDRLLELAVEGIHRQKVEVGYTNIYLMKTWNLLALGEVLNRPELAAEGSSMLDQWIAYTLKNGISEFLSPTYYGTDLDSLGLISRQLSNPGVQEKAQGILRLFWTDIAANWFDPAGRLGGAHGRDYDYLTGHGDLDRHLMDAGWIKEPKASSSAFQVFAEATRWIPPDEIHHEALSAIPRFVFQKWDAPDTAWASQYVGHHFSIGVSGSSQGPEDKPFALNLAGPAGPKTVMVNFFMDGRGDPYGKVRVATGSSGHKKAHHLFPFFSAVQSGSEVLFLASWPPQGAPASKKDPDPVCLQSHLDIPAEAAVWTQDKPVDTTQASQPLPGNICFLRLGDVAVGVHFLLATNTSGQPVTAEVVSDGLAYGARRLSVVHSPGPPGEGQGTVAVFVRVQEGLDDAAFATFRQSFIASKTSATSENGIVQVKAEGLRIALGLEADLPRGIVLHAEGADEAMQSVPMSVNGREYCRGLLQQNAAIGF
jgi:hypothetical protein